MDDPKPKKETIAQDDRRQRAVAESCGLIYSEKRQGIDAWHPLGPPVEVKGPTKKKITTDRDFGRKTIDKLRGQLFLAGFCRNLADGIEISEIWAFHPDDLEEWLKGHEEYFDLCDEMIVHGHLFLGAGGAAPDFIKRFLTFAFKGMKKNNPTIGITYVRKHGTRLSEPYAESFAEFVRQRPLRSGEPGTSVCMLEVEESSDASVPGSDVSGAEGTLAEAA